MNINYLGVRIIEDSDNRGSDNRGCTVYHIVTLHIQGFIVEGEGEGGGGGGRGDPRKYGPLRWQKN